MTQPHRPSINLRLRLGEIHTGYTKSVETLFLYFDVVSEAVEQTRRTIDFWVRIMEMARPNEPTTLIEDNVTSTLSPLSKSAIKKDLAERRLSKSHSDKYPDLTHRMSFIYLVAVFDAFLADSFLATLQSRPEMLRSKRSITYEDILDCPSKDKLIEHMARRELNEIGYKSIKDQADYYRSRFGLSLGKSGIGLNVLIELRAARNILVHNSGIVNEFYLEQVATTTYKLGDAIVVDINYYQQAVKVLSGVAAFIKINLIAKFTK